MTVSRDNFDAAWLASRTPIGRYKKFQHLPMREQADARKDALPVLREAVIDHHIHPESVEGALTRLGYPQVLTYLRTRLPGDHRTRMGNFGEVVASEHLVQRYGYRLPVFKLRFADNPAMPMRGEDVIGFVLTDKGRIKGLCIAEAKTTATFDARDIDDAHDRLGSAHDTYPASLPMISSILHNAGHSELAEQVDRFMEARAEKQTPTDHWIFLITGNRPRDPFGRVQSAPSVVDRLHCVDLRLDELTDLVAAIFDPALP